MMFVHLERTNEYIKIFSDCVIMVMPVSIMYTIVDNFFVIMTTKLKNYFPQLNLLNLSLYRDSSKSWDLFTLNEEV